MVFYLFSPFIKPVGAEVILGLYFLGLDKIIFFSCNNWMIKYKTKYEWVIEPLNENDDIIDPNYRENLDDYQPSDIKLDEVKKHMPETVRLEFALVVRIYKQEEDFEPDLLEQEYAYVENGNLPDRFEYGYPVPKYKRRELERFKKKHGDVLLSSLIRGK